VLKYVLVDTGGLLVGNTIDFCGLGFASLKIRPDGMIPRPASEHDRGMSVLHDSGGFARAG
jgi:hypothetical protein